jgi:hypothetical protein
MAYAANTSISVEKTTGEIVGLVKRAGAQRVGQMEEPNGFAVQFFVNDRMIRFRVRFRPWTEVPERAGSYGPYRDDAKRKEIAEQWKRQRARALLLVIKAKLESVESDVETFEEAFLSNVVMADGKTIYERIQEPIALEYAGGTPQMLLESPK